MERLIFKNANGQELEFNETGTYRIRSIDDIGGITFNIQSSTGPYQDGATVKGDPMMSTRIMSVGLMIFSDNIMTSLRELNSVLNPKLGNAFVTHEKNGVSRLLTKVRARKLPTMPGQNSRGATFQFTSIILEAFDPYYKDVSEYEAEISSGGNLFEFPVNLHDDFVFDYGDVEGVTIQNNGDVDTPITVILDGPKASPLEVINETTGEKIVLDMALLADERLTITTEIDNMNVIKTDLTTGATSVAFQYIDVDETTFFNLSLGANKIVINAAEAQVGSATVKYRTRYVGV